MCRDNIADIAGVRVKIGYLPQLLLAPLRSREYKKPTTAAISHKRELGGLLYFHANVHGCEIVDVIGSHPRRRPMSWRNIVEGDCCVLVFFRNARRQETNSKEHAWKVGRVEERVKESLEDQCF